MKIKNLTLFIILTVFYLFLKPDFISSSFASQPSPFSGSVNVITGEYTEMSTDIAIPGPKPLAIQRCFFGSENEERGEGLAWRFNHPGILSTENNALSSPSAQDAVYDYLKDSSERLTEVRVKNQGGNKVYSSLQFDYQTDGKENFCEVTASDGRRLSYRYQEGDVSRGAKGMLISHLVDPMGNETRYYYRQHPVERKKLIKRIEDPLGGYLDTEYYDGKHNNVGGTLVSLNDPLRDFRIGRIKLQKAPLGPDGSSVISQRFFYNEGSTDVIRANGQKTTYFYSQDRLLTSICTYNEGALHKVEKFYWSSDVGDKTRKRLISKTLENASGETILCQTYEYDEQGLLTRERCYGNISGSGSETLEMTPEGLPASSCSEYAEWSYTYERCGEEKELSRLIQKVEPNGKMTRYLYDGEGSRLHALLIGDREGVQLRQFNLYDEDGLLTETITDDGYSDSLEDLSGVTERHLAKFTLREAQPALGMPERIEEHCCNLETGETHLIRTTLYHYNNLNKVMQKDVYDGEGHYAYSTYQDFDELGRKKSQSEACPGKETVWEYDAKGNVIHELAKENSQTGESIDRIYDRAGRLIKESSVIEGQEEAVISYRYNEMSQKIADIDRFGNETLYEYDQLGRIASITYPAVLTDSEDYAHPRKSFSYDIFDNCTREIDPNGDEKIISYNILGKPLTILYPDQTKEVFEYYLDGTVKKQTDKVGIATLFIRDCQSRIIAEEKYAPSGQLLSSSTSVYNAFHLLSKRESNGIEVFYTYDSQGRQKAISKIDRDGLHRIEYEYDRMGNLYAKKQWFGEGPNDFSKCITKRDAANNILETYVEDGEGRILRHSMHEEKSGQRSLGKPKFQEAGKKSRSAFQNESTDSSGTTLSTSYDALGRAERVVKKDAFGKILSEVEMRYDLAGNKTKEMHRTSKSDAAYYTLAWKYGPGGRLEEMIEGVGAKEQRTTSYVYNAAGQLQTIVKPDGVTLTHCYNETGGISRFFSSDGTVNYEYAYDESGAVLQAIDRVNGSLSKREYNDSGWLIDETLANGLNVKYSYDKIGRCTSYNLPDGSSVQYQYNAAYLEEVARKDAAGKCRYSHKYDKYDPSGNILTETLPNDCGTINHTYNAEGRRTGFHSPWWSESLDWKMDGAAKEGRLIGLATSDPLGEVCSEYLFDSSSRLIQESGNAANQYTYDSLGNRASSNSDPLLTNSLNGLLFDGTIHYAYDANGNLTERSGEGEAISFQYDALNRLISAKIGDTAQILYTYDTLGRRIEKISRELTSEGTWEDIEKINYLYINNNEIGETDGKGNILRHRILGLSKGSDIGATIAVECKGKVYAAINDYRGNLACLVDIATAVAAEFYRYEAFGKERIFGGDLAVKSVKEALSPWRYSSKRYEEETGLVYFGKRYYSPKMGRWTTVDPLGHFDGINRYCYVHNNPMTNVDHYGLWSCSEVWSSFLSFVDNAIDLIMDSTGKVINFIRSHTHYLQQIEPDLTSLLEEYFGQGFLTLTGYYTYPLESGIYGQGEVSDKVRITLLNGISNIRSYYRDSLELLNSSHGGVNIHYIFRPTSGWCRDMIMALLIKCGYVSPYAKELAQTWKQMIVEMGGIDGGGTILHYCHSLGGTDTVLAASLLSPEERKMINVISFGSATMISNSVGFGEVINYVSLRDGVCFLDPIGYINGLIGNDVNIAFIGSFLGIPLIDHSLTMETYSETIAHLGHVFLQMYAHAGGFI